MHSCSALSILQFLKRHLPIQSFKFILRVKLGYIMSAIEICFHTSVSNQTQVWFHVSIFNDLDHEIIILHYQLHSSLTCVGYGGYTKMQMIRKYRLNNLVNPIQLQW